MSSLQIPEEWFLPGGPVIKEEFNRQPCNGCETCGGFLEHNWKKECKNCRCPKDMHQVCTDYGARSRIGLITPPDEERSLIYTWVPTGLDEMQINQYFTQLDADDVPKIGTVGEKKRKQRLVKQLPKQDLTSDGCKHLTPDHISKFQGFVRSRNEVNLDIGMVRFFNSNFSCASCEKTITANSPSVCTNRFPNKFWHPPCFRCTECQDLVVDLIYCEYQNQLFCVRHYSEKIKSRCNACDELIFSSEYTNAMGKDWHTEHFCCWQCEESLKEQRYVLKDEHLYSIKCYEQQFSDICEKCNRKIGIDTRNLSYMDKH